MNGSKGVSCAIGVEGNKGVLLQVNKAKCNAVARNRPAVAFIRNNLAPTKSVWMPVAGIFYLSAHASDI